MFQPLSYEEADRKAGSILEQMTTEEKLAYIGGDRGFFIRSIPRLGIREVYMTDATQGIHLRESFGEADLAEYQLGKSTAFPSPICLAATWNPGLAFSYAEAIGEECAAGNIGILLGPGLNSYRHSQCGRNFEYFGEDPFHRSRMVEAYVKGLQSTGTIATLKHFAANNTDFYRRKSNSVVDERTLNEIYFPPFKAGIDAGAMAIMTAYNLLNGEWCGQSRKVITGMLREQLGFRWLVMTDWWSVYDGELLAKSGQDLEMPLTIALTDAQRLMGEGKIATCDIDRMARSVLRTYFAMKFDERKTGSGSEVDYKRHEEIALQTAREGIVLLKNEGSILPLNKKSGKILLTGDYMKKNAAGGGAAAVEGFNVKLLAGELKKEFGKRIEFDDDPTVGRIRSAGAVICSIGTEDSEGWDRPFELPADQELKVQKCVANNPNTVVVVTTGSGIRMTGWNERAKAVLYAWYGGQNGSRAVAEIIAGKINPSGKLPITLEKEFRDSPGYGYLPAGETLYSGWNDETEKIHPVYDVQYNEGIFTGYRWYDKKNIEPLYLFGHGISYTAFEYSNLRISREIFGADEGITVSFVVTNTGSMKGAETAQLYLTDPECSVPRPVKELKGFKKIYLDRGESASVELKLEKEDFSFWDPDRKEWAAEKGAFIICIGSSSGDIRLSKEVILQ
jgi:beta-glucosidase